MAIVQDLAHPGEVPDRPYCTHNRELSGEPNGTLTPEYSGEIVLDVTNNALWIAVDLTNDGWVTLTTPA
jgi:hypothetical protein